MIIFCIFSKRPWPKVASFQRVLPLTKHRGLECVFLLALSWNLSSGIRLPNVYSRRSSIFFCQTDSPKMALNWLLRPLRQLFSIGKYSSLKNTCIHRSPSEEARAYSFSVSSDGRVKVLFCCLLKSSCNAIFFFIPFGFFVAVDVIFAWSRRIVVRTDGHLFFSFFSFRLMIRTPASA